MSDREILDRYINLDRSCLTDSEKKQVMNVLYKYKDALSLRDEIGTLGLNISPSIFGFFTKQKILQSNNG